MCSVLLLVPSVFSRSLLLMLFSTKPLHFLFLQTPATEGNNLEILEWLLLWYPVLLPQYNIPLPSRLHRPLIPSQFSLWFRFRLLHVTGSLLKFLTWSTDIHRVRENMSAVSLDYYEKVIHIK